jgi:hypothetical protein
MPEKETEIAVLKENLKNMKDTSLQSQVSNTADHLEIKTSLNTISIKLDNMYEKKADKVDVEKIDSRFWYLTVGFLMLLAGIIAAWYKK